MEVNSTDPSSYAMDSRHQLTCILKAGKTVSNLLVIMSVIERKKTNESTRKPNQRGRLNTIDLLNKIACFVKKKSFVTVSTKLICTRKSTVLTILPAPRIPCISWLAFSRQERLSAICLLLCLWSKERKAMNQLKDHLMAGLQLIKFIAM